MGGDLPDPRRGGGQESGHFDKEIVPVTVPAHKDVDKEGNEIDVPETVVTKDDGPRAGHHDREARRAEARCSRPDGTVTAGNACPLNDGAAALLVMSEETRQASSASSRKRGSSPRPSPRSAPRSWASARSPRSRSCSKNTGMTMSDIDVVEINEAFAAQIVPCKEELGIDDDKLNPFGGAIALGHPFGMTGARIMTTLLNDLETLDGTYGIESMCVAGGMGMAMLVERI